MPQPDTLLFIMLTLVKKTLILDVCIHDFGHVWFFFSSKDTRVHMCVHVEREGRGERRERKDRGREGRRERGREL